MINTKENTIKVLDGLRGIAALYVLVHHARLLLTQPYYQGFLKNPEQYNIIDKFLVYFFSLFKFGHEAVILFFVLSGFVIHLNQARTLAQPQSTKFSLKNYLFKRIVRIYPTLITSFVLIVILDFCYFFIHSGNWDVISQKYSVATFFYDFFLVPDSPIWGHNFPVWSLKHEWFFYLLYPLLFLVNKKNVFLGLFLPVLLYSLYIGGLKMPFIGAACYTLLIWWLGSILADIYCQRIHIPIQWGAALVPISLVVIFIFKSISTPFYDLLLGLLFTGVLAMILTNKFSALSRFLSKFSIIGTFSYSLYLLHFPILSFFRLLIVDNSPTKSLPYHLWYVLISCIITVPVIYLIYYYTERVAINYKKKIS